METVARKFINEVTRKFELLEKEYGYIKIEGEVDNVTISKIKKREIIINRNMAEVIEGLSNAVKKMAINIITGDTSTFTDVMSHQSEQIKRQYS